MGPTRSGADPGAELSLPAGSLTAVIGANDCGKSSLLKVIAGLQKPLTGQVELAVSRRGGVGFLPQQQNLDRQFPISLVELVAAGLWRTLRSATDHRERLQQVLADWRLSGLEQRPLLALSGGELQRALLARLSLTEAPLLLLDEPHAALDELGQALLWKHSHHWHPEGRTLYSDALAASGPASTFIGLFEHNLKTLHQALAQP